METKSRYGAAKSSGVELYRNRIKQLQREIQVNQSVIEDELRNVGEIIYQQRPDTAESAAIATACDEAEREQTAISGMRTVLERFNAITERVNQIMRKTDADEIQVKKLIQQNIPHYEKIGQAAFEFYQENPFSDQEHSDIFSELVQNQQELAGLESAIHETESQREGKSLIDRMMSRGKVALLKSRRQAKLSSLPRLYRAAGEKLSSTEFTSMVADESIANVAGPFLDNVRKIQELRLDIEQLRREKESLELEADGLCEGKRQHKRVAELENALKIHHEKLSSIYRNIGRIYRKSVGKQDDAIPEVREYLQSVTDTEKEIAARNASVNRLKAAIDIDQIERDSAQMQNTIRQIEDQIRKEQDDIAALTEKIAAADKEKIRLAKVRGPEEELSQL
ncbi:MAG TPA: hypothetical protein VMW73_15780 [Spirochaetia bacterium]|nr:hypothetical protein [Spirochaetia bacterium]